MNQILVRLLTTSVVVSLGMHGIGYALETNGGATRGNPIWILLCGYFELEKAILLTLGFYGALALGISILFCAGKAFFGPPPPETEEQKEKREAGERAKRRALEEKQEERECAAYLDDRSRKLAIPVRGTGKSSPPVAPESVPMPARVPALAPPVLSPEELKQRAIRQLLKG